MSSKRGSRPPSSSADADRIERLSPERAEAFIGLVRAGEVLTRELDAELRSTHRLGLHAYEVLLHLAAFTPSGCLRMTRLARQAPLSQSRMSRLVAELEQQGLVRRSAVDGDGRAVDVTITERGRQVFAAAHPTHLDGLERRLFSRLSKVEMVQLAKITAKLLPERNLEATRGGAPTRARSPR